MNNCLEPSSSAVVKSTKMSVNLKVLGYVILPHNDSDGFADTSLENLLATTKDICRLPFLNRERFLWLQKGLGVRKGIIGDQKVNGRETRMKCSAANRFLYYMSLNGKFDELGIPKNRLLITTTRKTVMDMLEFGRSGTNNLLKFQTKLKKKEYGKEMKMKKKKIVTEGKENNASFGLKFESFLTKGENEMVKIGVKMFSIHCLEVENMCFIYEAEIDAIDQIRDRFGNRSVYEIKTNFEKQIVVDSFQKYAVCNKMATSKVHQNQIESSMHQLTETIGDLNLWTLLQGELGNASKFIYGFYERQNRNGFVSAQEFICNQDLLLGFQIRHLKDFVKLLGSYEVFACDSDANWDEWDSWELSKDSTSSKLTKME